MAGLGTLMIALMALRDLLRWRGAVDAARVLWALMLAFPVPVHRDDRGWMTAELGRQPWLVYGSCARGRCAVRPCTRARRCSR
jgi:cytochrome d ubiquinol oxidase subunit I